MALIGKIRKNSWLLVVLIGLGLGGFVVMDMMNSANGPGQGTNQRYLGEVDGEKVDAREFERVYTLLYSNSTTTAMANRTQLWNWYVENSIIQEEADAIGLGVGKAEISELEFSPARRSGIVTSRFMDPTTRQVNEQQLSLIKQTIENGNVKQAIESGQLSAGFVDYWRHQRKELVKERLQTKLNNLVAKAMYAPTWMAEMGFAEANQPIDIAYVKVPFDEIDNTDISLSDADYENYLKNHRASYEKDEETRQLKMAIFSVAPTAKDSAALRDALAAKVEPFRNAESDSSFVLRERGNLIDAYYKYDDPAVASIADTVRGMEVGEVFGPYVEGNSYLIVKLLERHMIADSADTRHILLSASTPAQFVQVEARIDSIKNAIETGSDTFEALATRLSQDPGSSSNGGKYENVTPNQFVPQFNKVLFVTGQPGQLYKVRTLYGWHLVEVLKRSANQSERVKLAFLGSEIVPSKETQDDVFATASEFIANNQSVADLEAAAASNPEIQLESSQMFAANDYTVNPLGSGNDAREMIRWAFNEADPGDVSGAVYVFKAPGAYYDGQYVVAGLDHVQKAGLPTVANIKSEIEPLVINEKKGEQLIAQIQGSDLNAIANQFNTQVDTSTSVTFNQTLVTGLGNEPKVLATAYGLEEGQVSAPIAGQTGVFVVKLLRKPTLATPTNLPQVRQRLHAEQRSKVAGALITAMKKNANIEDDRATFY
jgi:peptidyl-prolyl cis-trans isomerase D